MIISAMLAAAILALFGALVAAAALLLHHSSLAHKTARLAFLSAAAAAALPLVVILLMWVAPRPSGWVVVGLVVGDASDPALRVRSLAEAVNRLIVCGALAVPALILSALLWRVSSRRVVPGRSLAMSEHDSG